jgi:hypothetical protein
MTSILSAKHEPRDVAHLLRYPEEGLTLNSAMSICKMVIVWAPAMRPSSLLVILHYLLKNNTTFMGGWSMQSMSPISHRGTSVQDAQGGGLPDGGSI